jgi:uncharacterized RDD family membrane protein YckC
MFCNYCRAVNPDDAIYCNSCGRTIQKSAENSSAEQSAKPATADSILKSATPPEVPNDSKRQISVVTTDSVEELSPSPMSSADLDSSVSITDAASDTKPGSVATLTSEQSTTGTSIVCPRCKLTNPDTAQRCDCGYEFGAEAVNDGSHFFPIYATMGQRFTAYFADLIIVYLIAIVAYVVFAALQIPLSEDEGVSKLIFFLVLMIYMVIAQSAYHTTVGKYVHGLEVCSERPGRKYPSFWLILLRETVGRLVSSFLWGAGYWTAIKKPKKQAWSDEIAHTVVTTRPTNRVLVRALTAFVFVALVLDVGLVGYGYYKEDRDKQYAAFTKEIGTAVEGFEAARSTVNQKVEQTKPVGNYPEFLLWQGRMRSLSTDLDQYESQIQRVQGLLQRGITENLAASEAERAQYATLRKVYDLRKDQAEKLRQEANLVVNCDGTAASMTSLRSDLVLLDSDIEGLERRASDLLGQSGLK